MTTLDWVIVFAYFALLAGMTLWLVRRNRDTADDYFLASRNLGWIIVGESIFASNIGSEHLVGLVGSGAASGVAMAHYELHAWCLLVLGWLFVPFYSRSKVFTMPEFLERRFSPFRWLGVDEIAPYLAKLAGDEKLLAEPEALAMIARQATGSLRDAISLLDQLTSTGEPVSLDEVQQVLGTAASTAVRAVVRAIVDRQPGQGLAVIHQALDAGADPRQLARQIVEYLRGMILIRHGTGQLLDVGPEVQAEMAEWSKALPQASMLTALAAFQKAAVDLRGNWHPALPLEMALIEGCAERTEATAPPAMPPASKPAPAPVTPRPAGGGVPPKPVSRTAAPTRGRGLRRARS